MTQYAICDIVEDMGKQNKVTDLGQQLRQAFEATGISRFELARRAGISYAIIHRFAAGDRDIRLETASKIATVLGMELRPVSGK